MTRTAESTLTPSSRRCLLVRTQQGNFLLLGPVGPRLGMEKEWRARQDSAGGERWSTRPVNHAVAAVTSASTPPRGLVTASAQWPEATACPRSGLQRYGVRTPARGRGKDWRSSARPNDAQQLISREKTRARSTAAAKPQTTGADRHWQAARPQPASARLSTCTTRQARPRRGDHDHCSINQRQCQLRPFGPPQTSHAKLQPFQALRQSTDHTQVQNNEAKQDYSV